MAGETTFKNATELRKFLENCDIPVLSISRHEASNCLVAYIDYVRFKKYAKEQKALGQDLLITNPLEYAKYLLEGSNATVR